MTTSERLTFYFYSGDQHLLDLALRALPWPRGDRVEMTSVAFLHARECNHEATKDTKERESTPLLFVAFVP